MTEETIVPSEPKPDANGIVTMDLEGEVLRLAKRSGVKVEDLEKEIVTTKYDQFAEAVKQYYGGKDKGFAEGAASALKAIRPYTWVHFVATFLAGAACYPTIKLVVKFVLLCIHFYNS